MVEPPTNEPASPSEGDDELIEAALRQEFGADGTPPPQPRLPEQIGPYKIIRRIGAGGMGVVYEAEQREPKRRVALKVIRAAIDASPQHMRLFQREIQVLGQLRHPSIARIYEAGHTEDGHQYFVMELIEGEPLIHFCESADLSLRDRLALFAGVCSAVHYAHQRGVIHRDVKPANVLVDEEGVPHVLDFGLARFLDPELAVTRSLLEGQALIGTLPYMSPEQTRGDPISLDIRTDVYSLGVILYEMLTGAYPYQVVGHLAEVLRHIAEAEPTRPSSIHRKINDEVEKIVLRALAKDRDRRYQSAETLGEDVKRYLRGDPVEAKRDSPWYVFRKLASKYRYATAMLLVVIVILASSAALVTLFHMDRQAAVASERHLAEMQAQAKSLNAKARDATRRLTMGWFLLGWHTDCVSWATRIRELTSERSPEYAAMTFLLDESVTVEEFLATLPNGSASFAQFVLGERHLRAGRLNEAVRAYEAALPSTSGEWIAIAAKARLQQLRPRPVPSPSEIGPE